MSWPFHRSGFVLGAAGPLAGTELGQEHPLQGIAMCSVNILYVLRGLEYVISAFLLLLELFYFM